MTNMYEFLSVNNNNNNTNNNNNITNTNNVEKRKIELFPNTSNTTNTSNTEQRKSSGDFTSLSGFLNTPILLHDNNSKIKDTTKIVKGDFYKDPELISKNCELFEPETPLIYTESEVIFNDHQKYKGILVITEFRLIFEFFDKEKKKSIKLPKDYLKFPIFSISKIEKNLNTKDYNYNTYFIEITLKDSRFFRFSIINSPNYNFYLFLETKVNPRDTKILYKFSESYNEIIKKDKNYYNGWDIYDPIREFSRQGVTEDNNLGLRYTDVNKKFALCESYPEFLIAPKNITDQQLKQAASYRTKGRLPILAYYYIGNIEETPNLVPTIWRSAQNKGGLMGSKKNDADISLIKSIKDMSKNLFIYDCRPRLNAMANRLNGGGYENMDHYDNVDLTFCEIDNIHKARNSLNSLYSLCLSEKINENNKFWSAVDSTGWFTFVYLLLLNAYKISQLIQGNNSVLIHCSDGWDRTSQLSSLSQILLDPFYRTINGFAVLIEKDWLSFGHQFALRNGIMKKPGGGDDQASPIFLQFLDAVHQLLLQNPNSFEFNEKFLLFLAKNYNLNLYGTFMFNNDKHRKDNNAKEKTVSVWTEIYRNYDPYVNIYYSPNSVKILKPNFAYYNIKLWTAFFMENNPYLRNEKIFLNEDKDIYFNSLNDFFIYEKELDKKKLKEKDDKYEELLKLTSGLYSKIKDNLEMVNSLDDKSKEILLQVKNRLLMIEKMKKK